MTALRRRLSRMLPPFSVAARLRLLLLGLLGLLLCSFALTRLIAIDRERDAQFFSTVQLATGHLEDLGRSQQALGALRAGLIASLQARNAEAAVVLPQIDSLFGNYAADVAALRALDPSAASRLTSIGQQLADLARRAAARGLAPEDVRFSLSRFAEVLAPGEDLLRALQRSQLASIDAARKLKTEVQRNDLWLAGTATVLLSMLVAGLAALISRSVLKPVAKIQSALQSMAGGERLLANPVQPGGDEFGSMGAALHALSTLTTQLQNVAYVDELTGLPNRARFEADLQERLRLQAPFALLFGDLDHFRTINDAFGHAFGDQVLRTAGARLAGHAAGQTVYRYSGDLYALCTAADAAESLAERLRQGMTESLTLAERSLSLTASFGYASYPADGSEMEALVSAADAALFQAKHLGRNNVQRAQEAQTRRAKNQLELAEALRTAIGSGQISPYFQPILDLGVGRIACVEALARWQHPQRGFVPPDQFIAVAEASGQIDALTDRLLREACTAAARWQAAGTPHKLAFNLSAKQVRPGVVEMIQGVLADTGLPASLLEIEITEGVLIERPDYAERLLVDLRALGVSVALDDFGTGYSSLSYLLRFPIDKIKVDKSFVSHLEDQRQASKIVSATISLARALDMELVAEGVEQLGQMLTLYELGCRQQQGWLFAKALPAAEFDRWLLTAPLRLDAVVRAQMELGLAA